MRISAVGLVGIAVGVAITVAACDDALAPTGQDPSGSLAMDVAGVGAAAKSRVVARAVARSMSQADVRQDVLIAMRDSRYSEHKLSLQGWYHSKPANRFATALADRMQMPSADVARLIDELPEMDFYLPLRAQRRGWSGGDDVLVASATEQDTYVLDAFDAKGVVHRIDFRQGMPDSALFVVRPAERRAKRVNAGTTGGMHIEPAGETQLGVSEAACDPNDVFIPCDPDSGGGSPPADTTRLVGLYIGAHYDPLWDETNEVIVTAQIFDGAPVTEVQRTYTGVRAGEYYATTYLNENLLNARISESNPTDYLYIDLDEYDQGLPDEAIGQSFLPGKSPPIYSGNPTWNNNGTPTYVYTWDGEAIFGGTKYYSLTERGYVTLEWTTKP